MSSIQFVTNLTVLENEVKSNLPLQMTAYFNAVFIPVWIVVLLTFLVENVSNLRVK